ncbi:MAG: hypothetical protein MI975_05080 [Cytophagales bacterium]|nr:hypothetical protein [Cytophagales bacterium]
MKPNCKTFSSPETVFFRPYFNYNATEDFQPGLDPERRRSRTYAEAPDEKKSSDEYRTTSRVMRSHKTDRVSLQHRHRYEFGHVNGVQLQRTGYRHRIQTLQNRDVPDKA